jgi:predicted O-methyltransferase YrrM
MEPQIVKLLAELEVQVIAEEESFARLMQQKPLTELTLAEQESMSKMMLAIGPETGKFLNLLLKTQGGKHILELGTSFGYSTIYLAEAARANGGRVTSLDYDLAKQAQASAYIQQVGLQEVVDFKLGDAMELLDVLPGPWDFVLLDVWKHLYIPCFDRVYEKLAPGAIVIAEDIIFPPEFRQGMQAYQDYVRAKPDLDSVEVGVGHGLEVTRKHQAALPN